MSRFPPWYAPGTHAAPAFPTGWDAANLGGIVLNGRSLVTLSSALQLKIDPRKKKGSNAAHPTTHGLDVLDLSLRLCVWTQEQMDDVDDALPLICPPTNLSPLPLDHPQLRTLIRLLGGKFNVLVKGCSEWKPSSVVHRGWEVHLPMQYWPPGQRDAKGKSDTPKKPGNLVTKQDPSIGAGTVLANPLPSSQGSFFDPPTWAH